MRQSTVIFVPKILLLCALALSYEQAWAAGEIGDLTIRPVPPAPTLPPAGGKFNDPTYGTEILRVTDRGDGDHAGHIYSMWTPFNANSTRFFINITGSSFTLYDFDPIAFTSNKVGLLRPTGGIDLMWATAQWHPTDPDVLYALEPLTDKRRLYAYNVVTQAYTLVHDFTSEVATGGYPYGLTMTTDGRYFSFLVSRTPGGGVGTFEISVVYDLQTGTVYQYDFGMNLNVRNLDEGHIEKVGTHVVIVQPTGVFDEPLLYVWDFKSGQVQPLLHNSTDAPTGHRSLGEGIMINNNGWSSTDTYVSRSLNDPHNWEPIITMPAREGLRDWQTSHHISWNHLDNRFFFQSNYIASLTLTWQLHSGAIYKDENFTRTGSTRLPPEGVRHDGVPLTQVANMPTGPGQWWYDQASDTLYVWLYNNADATNTVDNKVITFAWWPYNDEIVQMWIDDPSNPTKIRRLAHHQSTWWNTTGYDDTPRASSDRSGQYVMWTSNWGGSGHRDVFILKVSEVSAMPDPPPTPPTNLRVVQ